VLLEARYACRTEQVSFEIGFEGGVGVNRSRMRREGVPDRGASMPKTTKGENNFGTRLGEKIEGGGAKLTCWGVGVYNSHMAPLKRNVERIVITFSET